LEPDISDAAPDVGLGEIGAVKLLSRDQTRAGGDAVLAVGRPRARRPVAAAERGKLLLDPGDRVRRVPSSPLLLVRIEAQRRAKIGERLVELALALVDLAAGIECVEVLRIEPERLVDLGERALVVALPVVIHAEDIANAGMPRIEPKAFVQIRPRAI